MYYFNPLSGNSSGIEITAAANICLGVSTSFITNSRQIEIFFLIFHLIIPGYYIFLAYAKSIVHINLQLIVCSAVGSSYVYAPIRTIMMLCERDYIEAQEKIYMVSTIIRTWYHFSLLFTQLAAFVERLFASFIIETLITIYKLNDQAKMRFTTERARYSLSMRFQLHENFRLMKASYSLQRNPRLARFEQITLNLIIVTIICVLLVAIVIFVNVYNKEDSFRQVGAGVFDVVMTLIPLVVWSTFILSYPQLRSHFFGLLGLKRFTAKVEVVTNTDPRIYFKMLDISWR